MKIRPATAEDLETLVGFNLAMAEETEGKHLDRDRLSRGVAAVLASPRRGFYRVAEDGGEVVGALMVTFEWSDWRAADFFWIQSVYVRPSHRRRGVYRALHRAIEAEARAAGACGIRLYVERENARAQRTYEQLGMRASGYLLYEEPLPPVEDGASSSG